MTNSIREILRAADGEIIPPPSLRARVEQSLVNRAWEAELRTSGLSHDAETEQTPRVHQHERPQLSDGPVVLDPRSIVNLMTRRRRIVAALAAAAAVFAFVSGFSYLVTRTTRVSTALRVVPTTVTSTSEYSELITQPNVLQPAVPNEATMPSPSVVATTIQRTRTPTPITSVVKIETIVPTTSTQAVRITTHHRDSNLLVASLIAMVLACALIGALIINRRKRQAVRIRS